MNVIRRGSAPRATEQPAGQRGPFQAEHGGREGQGDDADGNTGPLSLMKARRAAGSKASHTHAAMKEAVRASSRGAVGAGQNQADDREDEHRHHPRER